jgi:phosphatidate cytidylyltransferase
MDSATMTLPRGRAAQGALKRVASAVVLIPIFVWMVSRGPAWLFTLFVVAVGAAAMWELTRLLQRAAGLATYRRLGVAAVIAVTASFATPANFPVPAVPSLVLTMAIAAVLSAPVWSGGLPATQAVALTLLGVLYIGWFLGHVILLRQLDTAHLVLFLVGVTWTGESAAYLVGSTMGRHKLAPVISPNKTVEGGVAQLIASVLGGLVLGVWLVEWPAARAVGAGVLLGLVGQIGDLAESVIKRSIGVKDTGNLIPGHGGVLDRVDGLLFNAPALYYYAVLGGSS